MLEGDVRHNALSLLPPRQRFEEQNPHLARDFRSRVHWTRRREPSERKAPPVTVPPIIEITKKLITIRDLTELLGPHRYDVRTVLHNAGVGPTIMGSPGVGARYDTRRALAALGLAR